MGFHDGELTVQRLAGVQDIAATRAGMAEQRILSPAQADFLARRTLAVLSSHDAAGRLWTSPLIGPPGFLDGAPLASLRIATAPRPGDPLAGIRAGSRAGLVAIDLAARRRIRVNGTVSATSADALTVDVDEAFGNCPQYIQMRDLVPLPADPAADPADPDVTTGTGLDPAATAIVASADTLFLGTVHPDRGADSSHRGGPPGFVRVDDDTLWWPDYPGNNVFNSMGNLESDPTSALLFVDFATGATLHLSGPAQIEWTEPGAPGDDGGTGRRVRFTPERVVHVRSALPVRISPVRPYDRNPPVRTTTEETA